MSRSKTFFDSLGLLEQTVQRVFGPRKDGGREWAQDGLKYFIRAKKKRAYDGELAEATIRNFYNVRLLFYQPGKYIAKDDYSSCN